MSQHDMDVANQGYAALRADLNLGLLALASNSSGTTEPASPTTHQFWLDTAATPWVLKLYDGTDWIIIGQFNATTNVFTANGLDNHDSIVVDANGIALNATQPCFLAHATSDQTNVESTGGTATTVLFGTEVFDQNADFASSTFTAPVTGRYLLYAKVDVSGITSACTYILVRLVTSNALITFARHYSLSTAFNVAVFGAAMMVDMDAADTAYVTYQGTGEAGDVHDINGGRGYTEFGGILLT